MLKPHCSVKRLIIKCGWGLEPESNGNNCSLESRQPREHARREDYLMAAIILLGGKQGRQISGSSSSYPFSFHCFLWFAEHWMQEYRVLIDAVHAAGELALEGWRADLEDQMEALYVRC